jgi:signal transduction histidine kinase
MKAKPFWTSFDLNGLSHKSLWIMLSINLVTQALVGWISKFSLESIFLSAGISTVVLLFISLFFCKKITQKCQGMIQSEQDKSKKLNHTAKQVAHDIRSPLSALHTAIELAKNTVPEEQRVIMLSAVNRIEDIANDLSEKCSQLIVRAKNSAKEELSVQLLSSLIQSILSEKRMQYRSNLDIKIEAVLGKDSYGLFAKIAPREFKRVLSNMINNSVEALDGVGRVLVYLKANDREVSLQISDNGKGIPDKCQEMILQNGVSIGKEKGSGLGLYHAKQNVSKWGGSIQIDSEQGKGTDVMITLPRQSVPDWFLPHIELQKIRFVAILDDDDSIHKVWHHRLLESGFKGGGIYHFTKAEELTACFKGTSKLAHNGFLFLCDHELLASQKTGLDVIEEMGIGDHAILVTSHYEEQDVRNKCKELDVKLLPKNLAGLVPIKRSQEQKEEYVLIDDEEINRLSWKTAAEIYDKPLSTFSHPHDFYQNLDNFNKQTNIYIDIHLPQGLRGDVIGKDLYERGFENIYLTTGYDIDDLPVLPWAKAIVGKQPPFIQ